MSDFYIKDWYWFVGQDLTRVYSSNSSSYVSLDDPAYTSWKTNHTESHIASEDELTEYLYIYGLIGPSVIPKMVDDERDRRITSGCYFNGHLFQSRVEDQKRVNGAVTLAILALQSGAQAGNLRWHGGTEDFQWLAADNTLVPMDVYSVINFGKTVATHESSHVFAGRALKNMSPIPLNFKDNSYWP